MHEDKPASQSYHTPICAQNLCICKLDGCKKNVLNDMIIYHHHQERKCA